MRIGIGLALALLLWTPVACKRKSAATAQKMDTAHIATIVQMNNPRAAGQLIKGFYDIEDNAWRWTAKQFVVELGTPYGAATRGATLEFHFTIPPVVLEKNPAVTLSASVEGSALGPETFTTPGDHTYKRDVPTNLLGGDSVKASFELDKAMSPGGADERILGVIANSAALVRR